MNTQPDEQVNISSVGQNWSPSYEWKIVLLLTLAFGLVGFDRQMIAPLFPSMMADLKLDYSDLGLLMGVLGITWGIFSIVSGGLSDRFGRRTLIVPAVIGFSFMASISGMAGSIMALLVLRGFMGVFEGAYTPTAFATVAEGSKPSRLGLNQGLMQSAFPLLGLGLGPIIATQLLLVLPSWRWVFLIVAIPGVVIAILLWFIIKEPGQQNQKVNTDNTKKSSVSLKEIFKHRNVPLGMIILLCNMSGVFVLGSMIPVYLTDYIQVDTQQMGFIASAIGFGGFLGQIVLPALSDRIGRKPVLLISHIGAAIFVYLFAKTGAESNFMLFALLFCTCFFCMANLGIITGPLAIEAAPIGAIATVAGIIVGTGEIFGGGVAPVIAGNIAQNFGIQFTLFIALTGFLCGLVFTFFVKETAPQRIGSKAS